MTRVGLGVYVFKDIAEATDCCIISSKSGGSTLGGFVCGSGSSRFLDLLEGNSKLSTSFISRFFAVSRKSLILS